MVRRMHTRIASRSVLGKRRRGGYTGGRFKRRRVTRARRSSNFTSQRGGGAGLRFRSRRISRRSWNGLLWRSTVQSEHYRSNLSESGTLTTPATNALMNIAPLRARRLGGSNFWVLSGGALNPEGTAPVPTFTDGDLVVRGGTMGIRLCNQLGTSSTSETLMGTVYLCKTSVNFDLTQVPASCFVGWDPTLSGDFKRSVGRVVYSKKFLLRDTDTAIVEYRMPIQKIDQSEYVAGFNDYIWLVCAGNVDSAGARVLVYTVYFNLSFVGDAV